MFGTKDGRGFQVEARPDGVPAPEKHPCFRWNDFNSHFDAILTPESELAGYHQKTFCFKRYDKFYLLSELYDPARSFVTGDNGR
jgi:hypothetical protein